MRSGSELALKCSGEGWLSQSGRDNPTLLDHAPVEEIGVTVGFDNGAELREKNGYFLEMQFFHGEAEDGKRYCASIGAGLSLEQVRLLHSYCGFLLANPQDFDPAGCGVGFGGREEPNV